MVADPQPAFGQEDECELIARCQSGDRGAFEALFHLYGDDVFRFAYLVVRDASVAQDVVQETFLKVYRSIGKFQFRSSFKSWLYRIAVNEAITMFRRRKVKEDLAAAPDAHIPWNPVGPVKEWQPEEAVLYGEERQLLRWAIGQLDPGHRSVVVLKYFHEFSDTEIALVVGCPPGTVKSRLHRARELLRHAMARQMGRPDLVAMSYARLSSNPV